MSLSENKIRKNLESKKVLFWRDVTGGVRTKVFFSDFSWIFAPIFNSFPNRYLMAKRLALKPIPLSESLWSGESSINREIELISDEIDKFLIECLPIDISVNLWWKNAGGEVPSTYWMRSTSSGSSYSIEALAASRILFRNFLVHEESDLCNPRL